ncbi:MAG: sigma 54-interacting transcriptional regulator, partial [Myxococcota bacterium]|nr:sigma 54-interacting transcriptional regulator [Myxococcota bacterium]
GDEAGACEAATRAAGKAEGAGWEARLRAQLALADALERAGRGEEAAAASTRARAVLDAAAATLSPAGRARLRAVPAYRRALAVAPASVPVAGPNVEPPRWRALARHAKRIVREPRLGRLREAVIDAAIELADAERGFWVERAVDGRLKVRAARAFGADLRGERPSASVAARALDGGRPLVSVDALEDERLDAARSVHAMALRSVLAVPLPATPRPGARESALVLDDRLRPGAFDDAILRLVQDLAEIAAGALERAEAVRAQRREARRLARETRRLTARVESAEEELSALRGERPGPAFGGIVAESEPMRRALRLVERVAGSDAPVLVRGESGTGKELVARAVHQASPRRDGPYVSENVSAIPDSLLESALFGHVRGAFTGADRAKRGLFALADGGSLFLDEIGEMSESMQAKLLRVLQDGSLRPVGGEATTEVDVRVIAATHRDLERMVDEGRFRRDLFYRIAVVQVELPPLRDRPDDVTPLVAAFLERHAAERRVRVDRAAMSALRAFAWPGNVRELENEIRRALVLADEVIGLEHLSPKVRGVAEQAPADAMDLKGQVDALERRLIVQALEQTGGNQTRAAEVLGLSRYGLQKMMKRLAVPKPSR